MKTKVEIIGNKKLGERAAEHFYFLAQKYIATKNQFTVALSGGSTPKNLYSYLVNFYHTKIDWRKLYFFWSDERFVPFDHAESNGGMAFTFLLKPLKIQKPNYFPIPTEDIEPVQSALEYESNLRFFFGEKETTPQIDLILLGMGEDGHTASLFPNTEALNKTDRLVKENWIPKLNTWRITFTFKLINSAQNVIFLVTGKEKATVVRDILSKKNTSYPSALVHPKAGELLWLLDEQAAKYL